MLVTHGPLGYSGSVGTRAPVSIDVIEPAFVEPTGNGMASCPHDMPVLSGNNVMPHRTSLVWFVITVLIALTAADHLLVVVPARLSSIEHDRSSTRSRLGGTYVRSRSC